jgi:hypothetical protein
MHDEIRETFAGLSTGVAARDADAVEDAIGQLEFLLWDNDLWPVELFDNVSHVLLDAEFLSIRTSYQLIRFIQAEWAGLTPPQRVALRPALLQAFDKFGDWLGAMLVAEIFGELYADDAALTALDRLSADASNTPARAFAAYGLGRLATTIGQGPLYARAVDRLETLAIEATPEIREEAQIALARLKKKPS